MQGRSVKYTYHVIVYYNVIYNTYIKDNMHMQLLGCHVSGFSPQSSHTDIFCAIKSHCNVF